MIRRLVISAMAAATAVIVTLTAVGAATGGVISGTVTASGTALADALVYVQHADGTFVPPANPITIDQRGMKFFPHVLPVVVGTTVRFLNNDTTQHNVFSPDNEKYNLGTWPQGQAKDHAFARCAKPPCVYVQLCRIHPEMEAYVVVVQNPFFAVTDAGGRYRIENVPPGTYSLGIWAPAGKAAAKSVVVDASKPAKVDFGVSR
jgi:plastocyanin